MKNKLKNISLLSIVAILICSLGLFIMTDGQQRSYDLTKAQVNDFITWYNNKAAGQGNITYNFNRDPSSKNFSKRTEYLIFDKISNYDVDEYSAQK